MDFRTQSTNHEIEENKKKLLAYLKSSDRKIVSLLSDLTEAELTNKTIDWRGTHQAYGFVSTEKHLSALIEHELLHEGELVVYFRLLGLKFPASWGVWGFR